ncbi:MAG: AAA family ATPase [Bacteroidales bacterium]|nr:AAA family ATPase [Bacteroidales bacterium]
MRFQKLTIHNIASIEDAVIDFDAKPLADSELFLITGKTGAGKSTLLDAICLALYNSTPRFSNTEMQGETTDIDTTVKVDDVRQLMRRNTAEAEVRLTFVGSNGVPYEAKWGVARSRKKVDGKIQPKRWELTNLKGEYTLTKDVEIKEEIRAAIGLDFNQFCRTTLLAQGEFTRFLNSKDNEKADILEKITGTAIYSKIGAKVFAVTSEKRAEWEEAQQAIEGTKTLTDEEIAEKEAALHDLEQQYVALKKERDEEAAREQWFQTEATLKNKTEETQKAWQEATAALEKEEFKTKETLVNDWNATIEARHLWSEIQKGEKQQKELQQTMGQLAEEYRRWLAGQRFIDQEAHQIATKLQETETFLTQEQEKADIYEKAQSIEAQLNQLHQGRQDLEKRSLQQKADTQQLEQVLSPALKEAQTTAEAHTQTLQQLQAQTKAKEEEVKALNLTDLRTRRDAARDLLSKIGTAQERLTVLQQEKERREKALQALNEKKESLQTRQQEYADMEQPVHDAEVAMNTHKVLLDKEKETIDNFAISLRARLQVGDTCPICRQKIHQEIPHEEVLAQLIGKLQQEYAEAEQKYKTLKEKYDRLGAEIQAGTKAYLLTKAIWETDTSLSNAEQRAASACTACGIQCTEGDPNAALLSLQEKTLQEWNALTQQIASGEKQEQEVADFRTRTETQRKVCDDQNRKVQEAENAVKDCQRRIQSANEFLSAKQSEIEQTGKEVASTLRQTRWTSDWEAEPLVFARELLSAAQRYAQQTALRIENKNRLDKALTYAQQIVEALNDIREAMPAWEDWTSDTTIEVKDLLSLANKTRLQVTSVLVQQKNIAETTEKHQKALDYFLQENTRFDTSRLETLNSYAANEIQAEERMLKQARENVLTKKTLLDEAQRQWQEHQQKRPDEREGDTPEMLRARIEQEDSQLKVLSENRGSILQELKMDQDNKRQKKSLIEEAEKRSAVYQKWARLNDLIGDSTGAKFRRIAQAFILSSLIHSANGYMKTLTDRYTLKVAPGTFVISIEDAYQGYTTRAASTISGGESFLVSLSLALALSDIGQNLAVDTLFIDEGFGTLSGEPLQNAINTLRSLHRHANRHVGIISHVEELRERIPVQIQVHQEGNNSSSTVQVVG